MLAESCIFQQPFLRQQKKIWNKSTNKVARKNIFFPSALKGFQGYAGKARKKSLLLKFSVLQFGILWTEVTWFSKVFLIAAALDGFHNEF